MKPSASYHFSQIPLWMAQTMKHQREMLMVAILLRLFLTGFYFWQNPLWEQYDEINHYQAARWRVGLIEDTPDALLPAQYEIFSQKTQPPLYHWFTGLFLRISDAGAPIPLTGNPEPFCDYPQPNHFYIHDLKQETPLNSLYRGIWLARTLTAAVGLAAVWLTWLAARTLWPHAPERAGLSALLLAVYSPAIALSAWYNNDAPLMIIGALLVMALSRWMRHGASPGILAGVFAIFFVGMATKLNAAGALPAIFYTAAITLGYRNRRLRNMSWRIYVAGVAVLAITSMIVAAAACNAGLCRTHRSVTPENIGIISGGYALRYIPEALVHLLTSSGTASTNPDYPPYPTLVVITLVIAGVGLANAALVFYMEPKERKTLLMLFLIVGGTIGLGLARVWWLQVAYMPVRYMALTFPAAALILAAGFDLISARVKALPTLVVTAGVVVSIGALITSYHPLVELPERIDRLPPEATPVEIQFANGITVSALDVGSELVTLYLTTEHVQTAPAALEVTLFDQDGTALGNCEMLAGSPTWPTTLWIPGEYVVQHARFDDVIIQSRQVLRMRFTYLDNSVYLDNWPDYTQEIFPENGTNQVLILR